MADIRGKRSSIIQAMINYISYYTHLNNAFHHSLASVPDRLKGEN